MFTHDWSATGAVTLHESTSVGEVVVYQKLSDTGKCANGMHRLRFLIANVDLEGVLHVGCVLPCVARSPLHFMATLVSALIGCSSFLYPLGS